MHRIPIIDPVTHNFLFLITHKRILKFLYLYVSRPVARFIDGTRECPALDLRFAATPFYSPDTRRTENRNLHGSSHGTFDICCASRTIARSHSVISPQIDQQAKLIDVLRTFQSVRISALPVVDGDKQLHDIYSKFDMMVRLVCLNDRNDALLSCRVAFSGHANAHQSRRSPM